MFERLRRRPPRPGDYEGDVDARLAKLSWRQAIAVGTSQAAALIPGISRSGFTMGGGLLAGLSNDDAARFGFLLATPVIFAAAALKLPELFGSAGNGVRGPALVAGLCAAVTTFFAVKFLLRFFQTNRLTPFGIYCIGLGAALHAGVRARRLGARRRAALWARSETRRRRSGERDDQRGDAVLGVVVAGLALVAETCPGKNEGSECAGSTK